MKVLHTADWHIGQFKGPVEDGVNLRSLDTVKCLEYMVEKAKEEKPDLVCISGDVFHQEQIGPVRYSDEMVTATIVIAIQYMKAKGLDGIRADVYQLILKAEHMYNESGAGKQKFEWVIQQARGLLPKWLQVLIPENALKKVIQKWFIGVKDLLDDGKVNGSQENQNN